MLVEKRHDLHENDIHVSQKYHIVQPIAQCVVGKKTGKTSDSKSHCRAKRKLRILISESAAGLHIGGAITFPITKMKIYF
jgi:hypothetical protein